MANLVGPRNSIGSASDLYHSMSDAAYKNFRNTSSGAGEYVLGSIEQLARP
jgi:hypothetical protein